MHGKLGQTDTILIADDDQNDALLLKRAIAKLGIQTNVQIVSDGEEALDYLQGNGAFADRTRFPFPTFMILDLKMPRRNGFDVLGWLKSQPKCSIVPVVVWSSSNIEQDIRLAYQLGANCYFVKPNEPEELLKLVEKVFDFWSHTERPRVADC